LIILTEIWISDIESQLYQISDYKLFVYSTENYRSGGVAVYYKYNIFTNFEVKGLDFQSGDALEIKLQYFSTELRITAIYRLHDYSIPNFVNELTEYFISSDVNVNSNNWIVIGDINIDLLKLDKREIDVYID
jgi:hypothetical protein